MHPYRVAGAPTKEPLPEWLTPTGPLTEQEIILLALELIGIMLLVEFPRVIRWGLRLALREGYTRHDSGTPLLQGRSFRRPESIDRSPPPWRRWHAQELRTVKRRWMSVTRKILPRQRKLVPPPHTV